MKMREDESGTIQARDRECTRCAREGRHVQAAVFVGLNDPDATQYPMCRKHADEWRNEILMAACGMKPDGSPLRENETD